MGRDEDIDEAVIDKDRAVENILERGRRTRKPTPRWLWIAAAIVGAICVTGFAIATLGDREPPSHRVDRGSAEGSGLGIGLVIGAGAGIVIGFSIARQRRSHSSRSNP